MLFSLPHLSLSFSPKRLLSSFKARLKYYHFWEAISHSLPSLSQLEAELNPLSPGLLQFFKMVVLHLPAFPGMDWVFFS